MIALRRGRNSFSFLFFCTLAVCASHTRPAVGTEPFPPTVISYKDGQWQLQNDYVGGSRILVAGTDNRTRLLLWINDAIPKADGSKRC